MGIIAGSLVATGHTTRGVAPADVTHATTEAYGISGNDAITLAEIAECDAVLGIGPCIEVECSQIYPSGTTHLLIHMELSGDALVPYGVTGIVDAARYCLVTDIDGITACLRDGWEIGGMTFVMMILYRLNLANRTSLERILTIYIHAFVDGEAR